MNNHKYSISCFINGILSLILGSIPSIYQAVTPVSGYRKSYDFMYKNIVSKMDASVDMLKVLIVVGIILIIASIILKFIKLQESKQVQMLLLFVPLSIIILFSLINYIPLFNFILLYA